jgi:hypothetical protein
MSWLNAHESYVMETITRDRVEELRSTLDIATEYEHDGARADARPDPRPRSTARVVFCPQALAKGSR